MARPSRPSRGRGPSQRWRWRPLRLRWPPALPLPAPGSGPGRPLPPEPGRPQERGRLPTPGAAAAGMEPGPVAGRDGACGTGAAAAGRCAGGAVAGLTAPAGAAAAGLGALAGAGAEGRGAGIRDASVISLAGLLTTRRWPGRGSWVTAGPSAAGREAVLSGNPGAGSGVGAGGRAPGRSSAGVLTVRGDPEGAPGRAEAPPEAEDDGSSGWTARRSPSRSALRRARSACASSIDDEWLFTPIPRSTQRSRASLLVSPSSRASS